MDKHLTEASKKLSWLLRHGAAEAGLDTDEAGWARIDDVVRLARVPRDVLDRVVRENAKARFEVCEDRVRAVQGHSAVGSADALEASWTPYSGDAPVWHGTSIEALTSIAAQGLLPQSRTHVHLAPSPESVVGKRAAVDVLLQVEPARLRALGEPIFEAPNGVLLARRVPRECIVGLRATSRRARPKEAELWALFAEPA